VTAPPFHDLLLPRVEGEAVSPGWTEATGFRPAGVTWHWTATVDLLGTRALLGPGGSRRGQASAHVAIGRDAAEGVDRYVDLADRAWHAGPGQTLAWDGRPSTDATRGSRSTLGVELVHPGYARDDLPDGPDFLDVLTPDHRPLRVAPWPAAQLDLCVQVGRWIVARCPWLGPDDHHGHCDLCPGHKEDPVGFPFAAVLRRAYDDPSIPDAWTPFHDLAGRRRALRAAGHRPGTGPTWTADDDRALRAFQAAEGLTVDGMWTVWVGRAALRRLG
jgi:N-acetyl-anhydromuramyl-L-alanine amidase AmpD